MSILQVNEPRRLLNHLVEGENFWNIFHAIVLQWVRGNGKNPQTLIFISENTENNTRRPRWGAGPVDSADVAANIVLSTYVDCLIAKMNLGIARSSY